MAVAVDHMTLRTAAQEWGWPLQRLWLAAVCMEALALDYHRKIGRLHWI